MLLLRIVRPTATHRSLLLLSFVRCLCAMQVEKITTHHTSLPSCDERHFFAFLESRICVPYSPGERSTIGFLQRELQGSFFTVRTPRLRMTWIRAEEQETQANKKDEKICLNWDVFMRPPWPHGLTSSSNQRSQYPATRASFCATSRCVVIPTQFQLPQERCLLPISRLVVRWILKPYS